MKITAWLKRNEISQEFIFNHIENGMIQGDKPIPKFKTQNCWKNNIWKKKLGNLVYFLNSEFPKVIYD